MTFLRGLWKKYSILLVAALAIGGFFYPVLGILGLMLVALVMNFRSRRSFCAGVCPNGNFLATAIKPLTRNRRIPRAMVYPQLRRMLCGAMLFCLVGLLSRNHSDPQSIGRVFWWIYMVALSLGIVLGLAYKPRAWCAVCPLGTLQDTIAEAASPPTAKRG